MRELLPDQSQDIRQVKPFSRIRLVVSDVDGTLLYGDNHELSRAKQLIRSLKSYGIKTTLATGRAISGAKSVFERLEISPKIPFVAYNGALCYRCMDDRVLFRNCIEVNDCQKIVEFASSNNCTSLVYTISNNENNGCVEQVYGWGKSQEGEYDSNELFIERGQPVSVLNGKEIMATLLFSNDEAFLMNARKHLESFCSVSVTSSASGCIEVRPSDVSKGSAIKRLSLLLGIQINEVLAIGDSDNDVEMFQHVGVSVSVGNSSALAKESTSYYTSKECIRGVIETLDLIKQAQRYRMF